MINFYKGARLTGFFFIFISGLLAHPAWGNNDCLFDPKSTERVSAKEFASWGVTLIFGGRITRTSGFSTGKGQCNLCHQFEPSNIKARGPNLFGIEERSHQRIKEWRYMTFPITVGKLDTSTGIRKGANTGEEYLRESLKCPSCYIVEGYESKKNPMQSICPVAHLSPIQLSDMEINAVIALLQSLSKPRDYSKVTVELPLRRDAIQRRSFGHPCYSIQ